jgi:alkylation response protein AidB-like acyl-CoA dehydrogenase
MPSYSAPLRDQRFVLNDVLNVQQYGNLEGFSEASEDIVDAVLEEGAKFCENVLYPLNKVGDREGCTLKDGEVTTPTGFDDAYTQMTEGGWTALSADPQYGGQGLPPI